VQWNNDCGYPLLPIDPHDHGAEANVPDVRTVVHLHGAKVLADSGWLPGGLVYNGYARTGPDFSLELNNDNRDCQKPLPSPGSRR